MTCSFPIKGYRGRGGKIVPTNKASEYMGIKQTVSCGGCKKCRIQNSVDWAIRCTNEMQLYSANSFITLTYNQESLPPDANLIKSHLKDFKKRLRERISPIRIRTFDCGEYGVNNGRPEYMISKLGRPHFHLIIFGYDFPDKYPYSVKKGNQYYMSDLLNSAWGMGDCIIGDANFQTAAYISRYITKKIKGEMADAHYERINEKTGEVIKLQPEYISMSNRPGIGLDWLKKYLTDVFPSDELVNQGKTYRVPRYYTDYLEKVNPDLHKQVKAKRKEKALLRDNSHYEDSQEAYQRAIDIELCAQRFLTDKLTREYENND